MVPKVHHSGWPCVKFSELVITKLYDIFRRILDPSLMEVPERDDFLSIYYDCGIIDCLIDILMTPPPTKFSDLQSAANETVPTYYIPPYNPLHDTFDEDDYDEENSEKCFEDESMQRSRCNIDFMTPSRPNEVYDSPFECPSNDYRRRARSPTASAPMRGLLEDGQPPAKRRISTMDSAARSVSSRFNTAMSVKMRTSIDSLHTPLPNNKRKKYKYLSTLTPTEREILLSQSRTQLSSVKCQIIEILSFCVLKHNCRIRYKFLAIYSVKFFRICLMTQSEYYARGFLRQNVVGLLLYLLKHQVWPPRCRSEGSLLETLIFEFFSELQALAKSSPSVAALFQSLYDKHSEDIKYISNYYKTHCNYTPFEEFKIKKLAEQANQSKHNEYWKNYLSDDEDNDKKNPDKAEHPLFRKKPITKLAAEELDREMQDAYLDSDDEDDLVLTNISPKVPNINFPNLPNFVNEAEDDDSDVPDFLKSNTGQSTSKLAEITVKVDKDIKAKPNFQLQFASKDRYK